MGNTRDMTFRSERMERKMYHNNIENATAYLQRILSVAGDFPLPVSGRFDNTTRNAVVKFKTKHGLGEDFSVDRSTFDKIFSEYKKKKNENEASAIMKSFPEKNEYSTDMIGINEMLGDFLSYFGLHTDIRALPYFYHETEDAIGRFCEICGLNKGGVEERDMIARLYHEHNSINKIRKKVENGD